MFRSISYKKSKRDISCERFFCPLRHENGKFSPFICFYQKREVRFSDLIITNSHNVFPGHSDRIQAVSSWIQSKQMNRANDSGKTSRGRNLAPDQSRQLCPPHGMRSNAAANLIQRRWSRGKPLIVFVLLLLLGRTHLSPVFSPLWWKMKKRFSSDAVPLWRN